ncbi:MAG: hypothetical protein HGA22_11710 [Clostridiales bacterium]|nr:hypothetical protein [Clostridiales bacterium]
MEEKKLRAGSGKAIVSLKEECFPTEGFSGIHDDLHIRVLILESNIRIAFMSVELTSLFPETVTAYKNILKDKAGVPFENSWVTVSHTFSAPHLWPEPQPGEKDLPRPGHNERTTEEIQRSIMINKAFYNAAVEAAEKAARNMQPAVMGCGTGKCGINANRNMLTDEGWWLGSDDDGFSDKTLTVLRLNNIKEEPICILYHYAVQSSVMCQSVMPDGYKLISGDLAGTASDFIEKEYGGALTALFLCGAAGDQEPIFKARYNVTDRYGKLHTKDMGAEGFTLLKQQGERLGAKVVKVSEQLSCCRDNDEIIIGRREFMCPAKKSTRDLRSIHPTKDYTFEPDGEKASEVEAVILGDLALAGVRPELNCLTAVEIGKASPFRYTAVATMVNGGAKYMADREAYNLITYAAMNSPFAAGSAEILQSEAVSLLNELNR